MTNIYLIRHAESEGNLYRRAHGHYNGQVTMMGHEQLKCLKKRFENETIDAVYSSDLDRTVTTAMSISQPKNLQINKTEMLREVNLGIWENMAWGEIEHETPELAENFNSDPANWQVEGSEDYETVQSRMWDCISEIAAKHDGETIAIVSHGFALRSFMCKLLGVESQDSKEVPYFDNTAVALLTYNDGNFSIEFSGDNSHLTDDLSTFFKQTWWRDEHEKVKENLRYEQIDSNTDNPNIPPTMKTIIEKTSFNPGYLALLDTEPVGLIALDKNDDTVGKIIYYYIKSEHRNRNFAEQLIGQAIAAFRELNKKTIQIIVMPNDKNSTTFMQRHGFKQIVDDDTLGILELDIT